MTLHNWSQSYAYEAARLHLPTSIEEVRRIVAGATQVHALGARHSFNDVADTTGDLIDLSDIPREFVIDQECRTVTVGAGTRYGTLAKYLQTQGFALHNMASLTADIGYRGDCHWHARVWRPQR
jgi:xylitol oxidase